jgi:predicted nucleic acid-binding protein
MFILDTDVISEMRKIRQGKADKHVENWANPLIVSSLFLSVVTIQELEAGVLSVTRRDAAQGASMRAWLELQVLPTFSGRILPIDLAVARRSAQLQVPNARPVLDALIAATALVHGMTIATCHTKNFESTGARLYNPWLPTPVDAG